MNFSVCKVFKILCSSITRTSRCSRVTDHLKILHLLPVKYCIEFKLCIITYKTMLYGMPLYLCPYIVPYCPYVSTWRSNQPIKSKNQNVSVAGTELWFINLINLTFLLPLFLRINSSFHFLVGFLC